MFWWTKHDLFLVTFLRFHSIIRDWMDFAGVWNIWWLNGFGSKIGGGVGNWLQQEKEEGLSSFCSFLDGCCKMYFWFITNQLTLDWIKTREGILRIICFFLLGPALPPRRKEFGIIRISESLNFKSLPSRSGKLWSWDVK